MAFAPKPKIYALTVTGGTTHETMTKMTRSQVFSFIGAAITRQMLGEQNGSSNSETSYMDMLSGRQFNHARLSSISAYSNSTANGI